MAVGVITIQRQREPGLDLGAADAPGAEQRKGERGVGAGVVRIDREGAPQELDRGPPAREAHLQTGLLEEHLDLARLAHPPPGPAPAPQSPDTMMPHSGSSTSSTTVTRSEMPRPRAYAAERTGPP